MITLPVFRQFLQYATLCLSLALAACGGGSGDSPQSEDRAQSGAGAVRTDPEETDPALESVYFDRRTPEGFYSETEPDPGVFQSVAHIKNVDIMAPDEITASTPRYELCSDDFSEALGWSRAAGDGLGELVDNRQTTLFFEFTRTPLESPHLSNLQRVYKCSIVDRSTVDLNQPDGHLGLYTELPPSTGHIRLLIEYLWTFGPYNNYGNAVLSSNINEEDSHYLHTLEQARLTGAAQVEGACDRIDVYDTRYRVDKLTGSITASEILKKTLYARFSNERIQTCEN